MFSNYSLSMESLDFSRINDIHHCKIHGCFWHRCPTCNLSVPKKNTEYWVAKFARNVERDERNLAELEAQGWKVLVLWEHQLRKKNLEETRRLLYDFVRREGDPPYDEAFPEEAERAEF